MHPPVAAPDPSPQIWDRRLRNTSPSNQLAHHAMHRAAIDGLIQEVRPAVVHDATLGHLQRN